MAGGVEASRDLRLGLLALESGTIGQDQLVSALRAWARTPGRALGEILVGRGAIDGATLSALEARVTTDLRRPLAPAQPDGGSDSDSGRDETLIPDPGATVAYAGLPLFADADSDPGRASGDSVGTGVGGRRFQVLRPHARGGLGEVFLAFDRELNRTVALKELQARRAHDPGSQARFLLEAELTGRLEHPGVVPVYSLGRYADGRPYYAMRLIEGETLRDAIERFHRAGGSRPGPGARELAFRRILRSVIDACNAVAYAHSRGVVHRDLKPENVMLGRFGETLVVDWGVAKPLSGSPGAEGPEARHDPLVAEAEASMTQPGSVVGTPRYMSPEQAAGDLERVGPASDVYGLGAILYCVLVGHPPFPDGDMHTVLDRVRRGIFPAPRKLRRSTDPALEAICLKAMALKPEDRHPSALELANELEAWLADVRYRGEQEQALNQVKGSLARLCLERAHNGFAREMWGEGMLWLARALENAPAEPPELAWVVRTSLSGWFSGAKLLERCLPNAGEVHALAFAPDGRRLATVYRDRSARVWDIATGSALSPPLKHDGPVRALAFSPDGRVLATAGDDATIRRWDSLTGAPVGDPTRTGGPVAALAFSPDGSRLAAAGGAAGARTPFPFLWDAAGTPVGGPAAGRVLAVAFAPDGLAVAAACEGGGVDLRDAATGAPLGDPLSHGSDAPALAFDPEGRRLLTAGLDGRTRLWDLAGRAAAAAVTLTHPAAVCCAGFRPGGGGAFATGCEDGTARLWDAASGAPIGEPLAHRARVDRLAFRPDGALVATGSPDGAVRLWCAATGLPVGPPLSHGGAVRALAFAPDGRRLATGCSDGLARCWQVPAPVEGDVERIACWVRVTTDLEFDPGDAVRRLDGPTGWELRRRLSDLGGPPLR
jgi:WD40 repeat protein/serine/threonine protein kinase